MFNKDFLTLQNLTAAVNKTPFVETTLSRFFNVGRIASTYAIIERGSTGLQLIDPTARGTEGPKATGDGMTRSSMVINSVKLARVVDLNAADIQNVRAFGTESDLETFDAALAQRTNTVKSWIEHTHENLRWGAVKGVQLASDGVTEIFNFYTAAGVTKPDDIAVDFESADRKALADLFADVEEYVRDGLGANADSAQAVAILYGKNAWRKFRGNDAVAALYDRYSDGAMNRRSIGGQRTPFEIFDLVHLPYYGATIGADEWRAIPVGVPNLFRTEFTPLDNPETANTLGLPLYATPEHSRFSKGYEVELASLPIHYVTQPECLIGGINTAA